MNEEEILYKAKHILLDLPPRRPSYFQLATMLVGREPTHQSKLWRILEEVRSKMADLEGAKDQIADYYDQIEIMKADLEDLKKTPSACGVSHKYKESQTDLTRRKAKTRMAERRIDAQFLQIVKIREILAAKQEEIKFLLDMYESLSLVEAVKPWDDEKSQAEYWEKKLGADIALRNVLKLPPDLETIKAGLALPDSIGLKQHLHKSINELVKKKEA